MVIERPRQVVIVTDGYTSSGEPAAAPFDRSPGAMVEMWGRPFLEHVVDRLREQGFTRAVMLGDAPLISAVQTHFGDGGRFGVGLTYADQPGPGRTSRLQSASDLLDDAFLLIEGDTYWPLQFDRMWRAYLSAGAAVLTAVYRNADEYAPDSVNVGADGLVEVIDPRGAHPGLKGIAIGWSIFRRDALDRLPGGSQAIEGTLDPRLVRDRQVAAYLTDHRYYRVRSAAQLPSAAAFLARHPTVILDRDGVLNTRPPRGVYVRVPAEFEWLPGSLDALRELHEAGYRILIATNQAGVGRGHLSIAALEAVHASVRQQVRAAGGEIAAFYYCPHDESAGCECRKPKPGMLFQAQRDFLLDLTRTCFLGDDPRDLQAADAAGALGLLVTEEVTLLDHARGLISPGRREDDSPGRMA